MRSLVYLQIFGPGEDLSTGCKGAGKRFLTRVHPYVIDEFVLGLEGPTFSRAALPVARVRRTLGSAHVLHRDVRHDVLETVEELVARLPRLRLPVHPLAHHLLTLAAGDGDGADRAATAADVASHILHESVRLMRMMRMAYGRVLLGVDGRRREVRRVEVRLMMR